MSQFGDPAGDFEKDIAGNEKPARMQIATHPVQVDRYSRKPSHVRTEVTLRAYEVYKHLYGEQRALITGGCRGGFSAGELIAFLYAHSFPKDEWRRRADEAFHGMSI